MIKIVCGLIIHSLLDRFAADIDYETFSHSFTFQPLASNEQKICQNLTLLDDTLLEDEESLTVTMDVNHHGVSIHINQANVIIIDDDEVTLSLRSSRSVVPEDVGQVSVCVDLEGSTEKTVEYNIVLQPGTAQGMHVGYNDWSDTLATKSNLF